MKAWNNVCFMTLALQVLVKCVTLQICAKIIRTKPSCDSYIHKNNFVFTKQIIGYAYILTTIPVWEKTKNI